VINAAAKKALLSFDINECDGGDVVHVHIQKGERTIVSQKKYNIIINDRLKYNQHNQIG
jgi:hypothetical protein